jgi:transposase-like protein
MAPRSRYSAADRCRMVQLYQAGESTQDIAERYGCVRQYVRNLLKQQGIVLPNRPKLRDRFTAEVRRDMVARYTAGESMASISRIYLCSPGTISKVLHEEGCPSRSQSKAISLVHAARKGGMVVAYPSDAHLPRCLKCDKPFRSAGKHNRICRHCQPVNHFGETSGGGVDPDWTFVAAADWSDEYMQTP